MKKSILNKLPLRDNSKWSGYLRSNKYGEQDCQLVTAVNAYYHLTGNIIRQQSKEYEDLLMLGGCIAGSCTNIKKVWEKLGIWEDKRFIWTEVVYKHLKRNCFFEIHIWHKFYGYHSIAVVDYIRKADCLRVTNFHYVANNNGWIFWEDLYPHIVKNIDRSKPRYEFRTFKLIK